MNDLLEKGLKENLVSFDADQKNITYVRQNKRLRFTVSLCCRRVQPKTMPISGSSISASAKWLGRKRSSESSSATVWPAPSRWPR
ncbi:hypothetical protein [Nitrosomonas sp.]|uniref:hypothetical protein n=1 Tax=Nitrosomonas sp. TaxID=42353 RepID=UPI0025F37080|nr:hypothetical protein [Nitrosomonas sp.]